MKPFVKKVIMPAVFAAFVCFTVTEQSGFFNRLLNYVYVQNYYLAATPDWPDCVTDIDEQYWLPAGECRPAKGNYNKTALAASSWYSLDSEEDEILLLVVEIKQESKDGPDACAPEGYVHDHDIVLVPEGAMHPTTVLSLNPIECTGFIVEGGLYRKFQHKVTPGVDYRFIPKFFVTYKPNLTLTVFSDLR